MSEKPDDCKCRMGYRSESGHFPGWMGIAPCPAHVRIMAEMGHPIDLAKREAAIKEIVERESRW